MVRVQGAHLIESTLVVLWLMENNSNLFEYEIC